MLQDDFSSVTSDADNHAVQVASRSLSLVIGETLVRTKIYLSVFFAHDKLGAAFYDSSSAIIYFIPDVEETSRFDITQQSNVEPTEREDRRSVDAVLSSSGYSTVGGHLFSENK